MIARPRLPLDIRQTIKSYTRALLNRLGPLKVAAAETGLSEAYLSRCGRPDHDDLLPLEPLLLMERAAGEAIVTAHLPALAMSEFAADTASFGARDCAAVIREGCDMIAGLGQASADGTVTPNEGADLLRQFDDLERAMKAARPKLVKLVAAAT